MSTRWALVNADNVVENIVVWDGQGEIFAGRTVVQLGDGEWCNIGASYDANSNPKFIELQE